MNYQDKTDIQNMIVQILKKNFGKKIGDTPTDALQLTPKKYVDKAISSVAGGSPGGSNTDVQFNDAGNFGGDSNFTWDKNNEILSLGTEGNSAQINTPDGSSLAGTSLSINLGKGAANKAGGELDITSGQGNGSGHGGAIVITANDGGTSGSGGSSTFAAGNSLTAGNGGDVLLTPGQGTGSSNRSGNVILESPVGRSSAKQGKLVFWDGSSGTAYRMYATINTTDATPTAYNIVDLSSTGVTSGILVEAKVNAQQISGSGGTVGNSGGFIRRAVYKYSSSTPALTGSIQDSFSAQDDGSWVVTFSLSGNILQLKVTGVANENISWAAEILFVSYKNSF